MDPAFRSPTSQPQNDPQNDPQNRPKSEPQTEKQKMLAGALYNAEDPDLASERTYAAEVLRRFNAGEPDGLDLLRSLLGTLGEKSTIRAPFFCDYGSNLHIGAGVFLNFGCVFLDVCAVHIGDGSQIGPAVQIYGADHPRDPTIRRAGLENGREVYVGRNVWIGGGAVVLPGVTIADDVIVGAGSVVTRDVPAGATVMGNPARAKGNPRPQDETGAHPWPGR
jgi:maltose O-acetyltransferase